MHRYPNNYNVAMFAVLVAISFALPTGTGANSDYADRLNDEKLGSGTIVMAATAPVEFTSFPRDLNAGVEASSPGLFGTTPQKFFALSTKPSKMVEWPSADSTHIVMAAPIPNAIARKDKQAAIHVPSAQLDANVDRIAFNASVLAPIAFMRFCLRYPDDCKIRQSKINENEDVVSLTKDRWEQLAKVNRDVNRAIKPQANDRGVMAEEWLVSPRHGDCNDYAVTKRHELLTLGWPSRSLLLAEVVVDSGEHHLILVVRTREDDVVLDNLSGVVRSVSEINYRWVRSQQENNPQFWSAITVARANRVAMNVH